MKGQSLPLEFTMIVTLSIVLLTGSLAAFNTITESYDQSVREYQMQKTLTETMKASYKLDSLEEETARITYQTPNREQRQAQFRVTSDLEEIMVEGSLGSLTKEKETIADMMEGESESYETTITKSGTNILIISGE